jgi:two-component system chemotaxis response regulator CheY
MKTMLVVDDSKYMRALIKKHVSSQGIVVVGEAENGKDGVEIYKELMPDIVSMDLVMDECNGVDAIKEIFDHDSNAKIIIVSSIAGQEPFIEEAKELGVKVIIDKSSIQTKIVDGINLLMKL